MVLDTVTGTVRASVAASRRDGARVVTLTGVPSFVLHAGVEVPLPGRRVRADVAFGGAFYAIVDAESAGVPVDGARMGDLRRVGREIVGALEARMAIEHPLDAALHGLAGAIFTAPPQAPGADLRHVAVSASGVIDRSPGGAATAGIMAVLQAMGLLEVQQPFTPEGIVGTVLDARVERLTSVGTHPAIVPSLTAPVWLTGAHTLEAADGDPLGRGFTLG
jgi:proline racemase